MDTTGIDTVQSSVEDMDASKIAASEARGRARIAFVARLLYYRPKRFRSIYPFRVSVRFTIFCHKVSSSVNLVESR